MSALSWTLKDKVAQLFVVGSDSIALNEEMEAFYRTGVGGLILFRHHLQPFEEAMELREALREEQHKFPRGKFSFISIDQEGGQIERLPHWLFPTGIMPAVFGLKEDPAFCEQVNREMARRLRWLGFNVNFTPTVDINREMFNPVIGARAYGNTPETVIQYSRVVAKAHLEAGVMPVAKHFPGHGSGTVDSHLDLPLFEAWQADELLPYETLFREDLVPAVMVAHGLYPRLIHELGGDPKRPASLSPDIVTRLLRQKMGFGGLVFTDDLTMGAVWNEADPVEVALAALEAGADILLYRRALPEALMVYEQLLHRVERGKISEALIDDRLSRILTVKARLEAPPVYEYTEDHMFQDACHAQALHWAQQGLVERHHQMMSPLPLSHRTPWLLVAPDRSTMRHYQPDMPKGKDLMGWCQYYGISPQAHLAYGVESPGDANWQRTDDMNPEVIVFVGFNVPLYPDQAQLYEKLKQQFPLAKMILASCGMTMDQEVLSRAWIHVQMPSYRPAALQALIQWLITPPKGLP